MAYLFVVINKSSIRCRLLSNFIIFLFLFYIFLSTHFLLSLFFLLIISSIYFIAVVIYIYILFYHPTYLFINIIYFFKRRLLILFSIFPSISFPHNRSYYYNTNTPFIKFIDWNKILIPSIDLLYSLLSFLPTSTK